MEEGIDLMAGHEEVEIKLWKKKLSRRRIVKLLLTAIAALGFAGCARFLGLDEADEEEAEKEVKDKESEINDQEEKEKEGEEAKEKAKKDPDDKEAEAKSGREGMPLRKLGKTGALVSILGLGGAFTLAAGDRAKEAEKIIHRALERGINYIDTAPSYGSSEKNIGQAIKDRREDLFLASKTLDRTYEGTMKLLHQSLQRLQADYLDLLQVHGLHSADELEQVMDEGGALEALTELKSEGLVRFTGISGHRDPQVLLEAIKRYDFDCILLSLNPADPYYQPLQEEVLPLAKEKDMGIIAMKVTAYGRLFRNDGLDSMEKALSYALSFPVSSAVVGISTLEELEENIGIVKDFQPLDAGELQKLEKLVEPYQSEVNFFKKEW
ncbi:MAG: aldo/keto reductase [Bacillota bacterium]